MSRIFASLLLGTWLAACGGSAGGTGDDEPPTDGGVGDGCTDCDGGPVGGWTFADVHGVPNLDDDDGSQRDWDQPPFAADDDFSTLTLTAAQLAHVPDGGSVELTLAGDLQLVRVFDGATHALGVEQGATYSFTPDAADRALQIEFGNYMAKAQLTLAAKDSGGNVVETATVTLQAAPLIMNHHLQPAEHVWVVRVNGNANFVAAYQEALGTKLTPVAGSSVAGDVWIQDEFEMATATGEEGKRLDIVIDSIRNRGLQNYSSSFVAADSITQTWGQPGTQTSYDSFGNLEATPPFTVNGVEYPFGKIYYGRINNSGLNTTLGSFLTSQKVQAPFQLPTNWLCVGHVDEFTSFVPDPSSPKGFKLLVSDTNAAWTLLGTLPTTMQLPQYAQDHGYDTVGDLVSDTALRALNDDIQADYLEPTIQKFKDEMGLTDADIIRLPSLFEQPRGCNSRVAALIPGMVNLIVANVDATTTHLFTADPFFRSSGGQANDPVIAAFSQLMPAGMSLHFVDNWDVYHMGLGEVHCGTNVRRTPPANWWTTAAHLMGAN